MKPVEHNVSPYLQQPLRSLEEVQRERRQSQVAGADAPAKQSPAAEIRVPSPRVDQSV